MDKQLTPDRIKEIVNLHYNKKLDSKEAYNEGYDKGRADAINAIKNDLHKRLTEEMNNPYQDQGLCQGLYFGIQRCDWYLNATKENGDG